MKSDSVSINENDKDMPFQVNKANLRKNQDYLIANYAK